MFLRFLCSLGHIFLAPSLRKTISSISDVSLLVSYLLSTGSRGEVRLYKKDESIPPLLKWQNLEDTDKSC